MENELGINRVTFALPGRQFFIKSSVAVNEMLPKTTEFVLRVIRLCNGLSIEQIQEYFGFSGSEVRLFLDSLMTQQLVEMNLDVVTLTAYASDKFYVADELPRFSVIKDRTDTVDFDLLTYHLQDGRNVARNTGYMFPLTLAEENIASSNREAELAYQRHFPQILRIKEKTKDKIEIYKIASVRGKRFFDIPLDVAFYLNSSFEIERRVSYPEDADEEFRLGVEEALSDSLNRRLSIQTPLLQEFVERFDDKVIGQYLTKKGFQFADYVRDVYLNQAVSYRDGTEPMLGSVYMPGNAKRVLAWVEAAFSGERDGTRDAQKLYSSIAWLAPESLLWGRSSLFDELYSGLETRLPKPPKQLKQSIDRVHILYPTAPDRVQSATNQFRGLKEKSVHFCSGEVMGGRAEVILLPLKMACVLFHFAPAANSAVVVPIGFITRREDLIKEAQVAIFDATNGGAAYLGKAQPRKDDKKQQPSTFEEQFSFVNYGMR